MRGGSKEFRYGLLCGALLVFGLAGAARAEETIVTITVDADPVKSNGSPWDGYPAVGGRIVVPEQSNAPDIGVCVVQATGAPDCVWRIERSGKKSHCPDSTTCTIPGLRLPALPIGLVFLDLDLIRHDLIDFAILTDTQSSPDDIAKVDANLHAVMVNLVQGVTARERDLRKHKARVLPMELCIGSTQKCDLTQSRFWLEKK